MPQLLPKTMSILKTKSNQYFHVNLKTQHRTQKLKLKVKQNFTLERPTQKKMREYENSNTENNEVADV